MKKCENCIHLHQRKFEPWHHYGMPKAGSDFFCTFNPEWKMIKAQFGDDEFESNHYCGHFKEITK